MELNNINPFIRFAKNIKNELRQECLQAVDYHFYYIVSEKCTINIDGTCYSLMPATVVIIPPGTKYFFESYSKVEIISINYDYTQNNSHIITPIEPIDTKSFNASQIIEKSIFEYYPVLNEPLVFDNMGFVYDGINRIIAEFTYKTQLYREVASAIFKHIIYKIVRHVTFGKNNNRGIVKILNYIHSHYHEEIDNNLLASVSGYHPYHLNRLMKTYTGTTLRQYIINHRIECAKQHLRESNEKITKIAELCGYNDFCNFSSEFKRKTGLTPSDYRKETQHLL